MLKRLLIALSAALFAASAQAETFNFPLEEIAIDIPDGWVILNAENLADQTDDSDFGKELKRMNRINQQLSLLVSAVREFPPIGVTPGIHVNIHPGRVVDLDEAMGRVVTLLSRNSRDFAVLVDPAPDKLGPFDTSVMTYRYNVASDGLDLAVEETFWLVPLGDKYLTISTGVAAEEGQSARATLIDAAKSLRPYP